MKILYIVNSRIPTEKAHGIQITKMCGAFANQGVKVELILPTRKNKQFKQTNIFDYYQVKQNFKIKKVFSPDPYWLMKLPSGIYIKFQALFFIISLFFYLLFKRNKAKYIFYTRDEYLLPVLQLFSKQVVWEAHTLPRHSIQYLKFWQRCYRLITISQKLKIALLKLGLEQDKILVVPDAVDWKKFNFQTDKTKLRKKLGLSLNKKIILYSGHLYVWKGAYLLAQAAQYLPADFLIVFVGGTQDDIYKFKQDYKLLIKQNKILILGYRPPAQVPAFLKAADVLILPNSQKDVKSSWTSPLKLFEYLASGTPIISADLPVIREVLDEKLAVFFKADNPQDLAAKIKLVFLNYDSYLKFKQSRSAIARHYSWGYRAQQIINFLNF